MSHTYRSLPLLILLPLLIVAACHKDPAAASGTIVSKVKTATTISNTGVSLSYTYTYDSSGRQLTATTDTAVTSYTYAPGSLTETLRLAGQSFVTSYTTDTRGRVIADSRHHVYSYDPSGYRTLLADTTSAAYDSIVYTISGGDLSLSVEHQADAATDSRITTTYTYYSAIDGRDYGMTAMGLPSNNLIKTQTITQLINGATYSISYSYTYSYDAGGRLSREVKSSGTATYTTTYTYY